MRRDEVGFRINTPPSELENIHTGGNVELEDGMYRITRIQSVSLRKDGRIEIRGICKPLKRKEDAGE